jgi:hypothetical protein
LSHLLALFCFGYFPELFAWGWLPILILLISAYLVAIGINHRHLATVAF